MDEKTPPDLEKIEPTLFDLYSESIEYVQLPGVDFPTANMLISHQIQPENCNNIKIQTNSDYTCISFDLQIIVMDNNTNEIETYTMSDVISEIRLRKNLLAFITSSTNVCLLDTKNGKQSDVGTKGSLLQWVGQFEIAVASGPTVELWNLKENPPKCTTTFTFDKNVVDFCVSEDAIWTILENKLFTVSSLQSTSTTIYSENLLNHGQLAAISDQTIAIIYPNKIVTRSTEKEIVKQTLRMASFKNCKTYQTTPNIFLCVDDNAKDRIIVLYMDSGTLLAGSEFHLPEKPIAVGVNASEKRLHIAATYSDKAAVYDLEIEQLFPNLEEVVKKFQDVGIMASQYMSFEDARMFEILDNSQSHLANNLEQKLNKLFYELTEEDNLLTSSIKCSIAEELSHQFDRNILPKLDETVEEQTTNLKIQFENGINELTEKSEERQACANTLTRTFRNSVDAMADMSKRITSNMIIGLVERPAKKVSPVTLEMRVGDLIDSEKYETAILAAIQDRQVLLKVLDSIEAPSLLQGRYISSEMMLTLLDTLLGYWDEPGPLIVDWIEQLSKYCCLNKQDSTRLDGIIQKLYQWSGQFKSKIPEIRMRLISKFPHQETK